MAVIFATCTNTLFTTASFEISTLQVPTFPNLLDSLLNSNSGHYSDPLLESAEESTCLILLILLRLVCSSTCVMCPAVTGMSVGFKGVFRAKHKQGFLEVKALDVQTNFLIHRMYPDFPVFPTNLYMPVNVLEDYFALQILQKLLPATWRTLVQWLGVELNTKRICCWAMLQN